MERLAWATRPNEVVTPPNLTHFNMGNSHDNKNT